MGTNTDAILFYGFHGEEGEWGDVVNDWEERLTILGGAVKPSAAFSDATKAAYIDFWDAEKKATLKEPCAISIHCSDSCSMPFACVRESVTRASRGDAIEIKSLETQAWWNDALRSFAEKMSLPWQEPKWWLVSYWSE